MNFPACFDEHVDSYPILFINSSSQLDISKVNLQVIKQWITNRVVELLGLEDDVLIDYVFSMLEEEVFSTQPPFKLNFCRK